MHMQNETVVHIPQISLNEIYKGARNLFLSTFKDFQMSNLAFANTSHRVTYYQLLLLEKGKGFLRIDSKNYELRSKSLVTISKGQVVRFEPENTCEGYILIFTDEFIHRNSDDLDWISTLNIFDNSKVDLPLDLMEEEFSELTDIYKKMKKEFSSESNFVGEEILRNHLLTFLLVVERYYRKKLNKKEIPSQGSNDLIVFKRKLEENYKESHSVNRYAELLNITPKKLNEIIIKSFGKSTKKVIEERVLLESKRFLIYTNFSIKEIGNELGFTDPTNFNKFFKKYEHITPLNFRNSHKADLYC